jgi:L-lactate dehydrogenase complex protein LldF
VEAACRQFPKRARIALDDPQLQGALGHIKAGFVGKRVRAVAQLPEFEELCAAAQAVKEHSLAHLDFYLEAFEARVVESGGQVHWAADAAQARQMVLDICQAAGAATVTKGKSMIAEEIALNEHLERNGVTPIETDLGEYIIQLRKEPPSHIIAPAIHLNRHQIGRTFAAAHGSETTRPNTIRPNTIRNDPGELLAEARTVLRRHFLKADVGITGANLLVAETGSAVIVTNEGNADLTRTLPRLHIVLASIEKVVPTVNDALTILRVLARSATGQEFSAYTSFASGPRRAGEADGPEEFHVVLLDNGRSRFLGGEFRDMLRCIRCAACINHCPVYGAVGGHAYGWVYPGPMGAVLTPLFLGIGEARDLPFASTFCGRCETVCPVGIPLVELMRRWRSHAYQGGIEPPTSRFLLRLWAWIARHPRIYRRLADWGSVALRRLLRGIGSPRPVPEGQSFLTQWKQKQGARDIRDE